LESLWDKGVVFLTAETEEELGVCSKSSDKRHKGGGGGGKKAERGR